jgi:hypothetical protein
MIKTTTPDGMTLSEATVTINGHTLSFAESMTLRVALSAYLATAAELNNSRLKTQIFENYQRHGTKVLGYMQGDEPG